jgi:membrane AbrB-like protein
MTNAIRLLVVALIGAALASRLRIPGAWMIGPMLAITIAKLGGVNLRKAPRAYGEIGKVLLGTFIGATFNRAALAQLGHLLLPAIGSTLVMIVVGLTLAWMLARLTDLDIGTALFSLTPGGMPEMVAVAEETSADLGVVATLQFLRYSSVVMLAPAILDWILS